MHLFKHNISVLTASKVAFHSFSHLEQQPTTPAELSLFHLREEIYIGCSSSIFKLTLPALVQQAGQAWLWKHHSWRPSAAPEHVSVLPPPPSWKFGADSTSSCSVYCRSGLRSPEQSVVGSLQIARSFPVEENSLKEPGVDIIDHIWRSWELSSRHIAFNRCSE